ncbi:hypothetical protein, partial [Serratia marcescens]|uniref:hypothetical protein n=1 Tax=Serratia marcescens TaxID=615 RepID=UPI00197E2239
FFFILFQRDIRGFDCLYSSYISFCFFYFVVPDFWFLCSLLTILIAGAIKIYKAHKGNDL